MFQHKKNKINFLEFVRLMLFNRNIYEFKLFIRDD